MRAALRDVVTVLSLAAALGGSASAATGDTFLVSVHYQPPVRLQFVHPYAVSDDGRYVAFKGDNDSLAPGDTNGHEDCLVRDRAAGRTLIASVAADGSGGNGDSECLSLTPNGRYVLFRSTASNLVGRDGNSAPDVFLRDLVNDLTERVSVTSGGDQLPGSSGAGSMSDDGRIVVFRYGGGLVVRDRVTRQTRFVDAGLVTSSPWVSPDGRYVAYGESGRLLLLDLGSGARERIDVASTGAGASVADAAARGMSADGRYVLFVSSASNLAPGDFDAATDVFLRDRANGTTERVSVRADGFEWAAAITQASLSEDARFIAWSVADGRAAETPNVREIFLRDRSANTTKRVNRNSAGTLANRSSLLPVLSSNGRYLAFASYATNLSTQDVDNVELDTYLRELSVPDGGTFTVSVGEMFFGPVRVGTRGAAKSVTVSNVGTETILLQWIGFTGTDASQFVRARYCGKTLDAGASCTIDVAFAPTSTGDKKAILIVSTGATTQKAYIGLYGTGT